MTDAFPFQLGNGYKFLSSCLNENDPGFNKVFAERAEAVAELATNILYDRQESDPNYKASCLDYGKAMEMAELLSCLKKPWLSDKTRKSLVSYLQGLSIDSPEDVSIKNLEDEHQKSLDQHLYACMYFTRALKQHHLTRTIEDGRDEG